MTDFRELPHHEDLLPWASRLAALPGFVWLDSVGQGLEILSACPRLRLEQTGEGIWLRQGHLREPVTASLPEMMTAFLRPATCELPFDGGWIGYLGYDHGQSRILGQTCTGTPPSLQAGLYDWALVADHRAQRIYLVFRDEMDAGLKDMILASLEAGTASDSGPEFRLNAPFLPDQSREYYGQAFRRIQDYIRAGDCYQVNYAQRFTALYEGDPWQAYLGLRQAARAPYGAFCRTPGGAVLSFSPEQFIRIQGDQVITAPIKGTRPRGRTPEEDDQLRRELAESPKDRAENLMIVDLLRNDLSLHAELGSVRVDRLFEVQTFANVHHLVSRIRATKKPGVPAMQVLLDAFPGGSITGAPKKRAMEIIAELEPQPRSVYCGSLFWLSHGGDLDSSIAIRTLVCEDGQVHCWGGGGIVMDSEENAEYEESLNKVRLFMSRLEDLFLR